MSGVSTLTVLGAVPLVGAAVIGVLPRGRDLLVKQVALVASLVVLVLTIIMWTAFEPNGARFQFTETHDWISAFGVKYAVGVDGIALVLIALVAVLVPVVLLASWHDAEPMAERMARLVTPQVTSAQSARPGAAGGSVAVLEGDEGDGGDGGDDERGRGAGADAPVHGSVLSPPPTKSVKTFFVMMLLLETMLIGVFAATDVFLFYILFESMLIPMYFLIGSYGGPRRSYAAMKFLLYSLLGGLLMLAALIGLYVTSADQLGTGTFDFLTLIQLEISKPVQIALFLGFFIGFAIKAPLFPFHTWLPDAGAEGPVGGSVLLVGVLDKVGTFGFLRYCLPLFPDASRELAPYVIVLSVIGVLYGALLAMSQRDLLRFVSYTSVAHFGFIALGCFALTTQAGTGAVFYMFNHGLSTGALFLVVGYLVVRGGTRNYGDYSGIGKVAPVLAGLFVVVGMSSLALPGLSTFVSEFLVLVGTFTRYRVAAVFATVGIILAALYILLMYQRTMQGPLSAAHARMKDLSLREVMTIAPLVALMLFLGFYPKPLTDVITPSIQRTLQDVGVSDPAPTAALPSAAAQGFGAGALAHTGER